MIEMTSPALIILGNIPKCTGGLESTATVASYLNTTRESDSASREVDLLTRVFAVWAADGPADSGDGGAWQAAGAGRPARHPQWHSEGSGGAGGGAGGQGAGCAGLLRPHGAGAGAGAGSVR
eukprot:1195775-Prorocentrum_minimum.AAC.3